MPVRRSWRDEARQLLVADGALAVDGGDVCRGAPRAVWCASAARCGRQYSRRRWRRSPKRLLVKLFVVAVGGFMVSTRCGEARPLAAASLLSLSIKSAPAEATRAALRRRRGLLGVLNLSAASAGNAGTPLFAVGGSTAHTWKYLRCRLRRRRKRLLVRLSIVAASSSASSTPSRDEASLREGARRLKAASAFSHTKGKPELARPPLIVSPAALLTHRRSSRELAEASA